MPTKDWEKHYSILNEYQRDEPMKALVDVCRRSSLFAQRIELLDFLTAAMQSSQFEDDTPEAKGDRIWFFETVLTLFEVSYLISELVIKNQLTYNYKAV